MDNEELIVTRAALDSSRLRSHGRTASLSLVIRTQASQRLKSGVLPLGHVCPFSRCRWSWIDPLHVGLQLW